MGTSPHAMDLFICKLRELEGRDNLSGSLLLFRKIFTNSFQTPAPGRLLHMNVCRDLQLHMPHWTNHLTSHISVSISIHNNVGSPHHSDLEPRYLISLWVLSTFQTISSFLLFLLAPQLYPGWLLPPCCLLSPTYSIYRCRFFLKIHVLLIPLFPLPILSVSTSRIPGTANSKPRLPLTLLFPLNIYLLIWLCWVLDAACGI